MPSTGPCHLPRCRRAVHPDEARMPPVLDLAFTSADPAASGPWSGLSPFEVVDGGKAVENY